MVMEGKLEWTRILAEGRSLAGVLLELAEGFTDAALAAACNEDGADARRGAARQLDALALRLAALADTYSGEQRVGDGLDQHEDGDGDAA